MEPKRWFESRTLGAVVLFLALLAALLTLTLTGHDVPAWLGEGAAVVFALVVAWLRVGTDRPIAGRSPADPAPPADDAPPGGQPPARSDLDGLGRRAGQ